MHTQTHTHTPTFPHLYSDYVVVIIIINYIMHYAGRELVWLFALFIFPVFPAWI